MLYRSFIAFELPDEIKEYCSSVKKSLISKGVKGKWIKPENLHISVYFLGNRSHEDLLSIAQGIESLSIDLTNICFEVSGFKVFGSSYKVLTFELIDTNQTALNIVNKILTANNLKNDHPEWIPHLTLTRFKTRQDRQSLKDINPKKGFQRIQFFPVNLAVFTSKTTQSGPIYKKLN